MRASHSRALRILVVEDEAIVLMQLESLLEDAGHSVVGTAMTADEAIPLIHDLHPELVLLDLQLKDGSSGLDVASAIRRQTGTTVVFLTANVLLLDEQMNGAAAVIAKPFSDRAMEGSIAYLEECVHRPPPTMPLPLGMRLSPTYSSWMERLRSPTA